MDEDEEHHTARAGDNLQQMARGQGGGEKKEGRGCPCGELFARQHLIECNMKDPKGEATYPEDQKEEENQDQDTGTGLCGMAQAQRNYRMGKNSRTPGKAQKGEQKERGVTVREEYKEPEQERRGKGGPRQGKGPLLYHQAIFNEQRQKQEIKPKPRIAR